MKIPTKFDSVAKIEGEPTDPLVAGRLVEHVSIEAFAANYFMDIRSTLPADLAERERIATKLGIDIQDDAIPFLPSGMSEQIITQVGFELRNSIILRPRNNSAIDDTPHSLGIHTQWERNDREHLYRVRLSVGEAAINRGIYRLGVTNLEAHETPEPKYETDELARAVETGKVLVCKQPSSADIDTGTVFLWPLHDNVFHLYSNILLQTAEFTDLLRRMAQIGHQENLMLI